MSGFVTSGGGVGGVACDLGAAVWSDGLGVGGREEGGEGGGEFGGDNGGFTVGTEIQKEGQS